MRKLVAFFVAPLVVMLPAALSPANWGFFAFLTLFYSYPLALFLGLPTYLYFRRKRWLALWQVVCAGAAIGTLIPTYIVVMFGLSGLGDPPPSSADASSAFTAALALPILGAVLGAFVALVFWLIAIRLGSRLSRADEHAI